MVERSAVRPRALIVDGDRSERRTLRDMLLADGFNVVSCSKPERVPQLLATRHIDVVIEGEKVPIERYPVSVTIVYQQDVAWMMNAEKQAIEAQKGVRLVDKNPDEFWRVLDDNRDRIIASISH